MALSSLLNSVQLAKQRLVKLYQTVKRIQRLKKVLMYFVQLVDNNCLITEVLLD